MIIGNLAPTVLELPMKGQPVMLVTVADSAGIPVNLDGRSVNFKIYTSPTESTHLVERTTVDGITKLLPYSLGQLQIELTSLQKDSMSPQALYYFALTVTDDISSQIVATIAGHVLPVSVMGMAVAGVTGAATSPLSVSLVNVVVLQGEAGGVGYLDGIVTVSQPVGCVVQFVNPQNAGAQEQWILETSTAATDPGARRRPLDYNASTNTKVWRRIL